VPAGKGPVTLTIDWTPEHAVRIALLISSVAGLACLIIVGFALVRRRRDTGLAPSDAAFEWPRPAARPLAGVAWIVGTVGVVGALVVRPWVGAVVALATLAAARWPAARTVIRVAPALLVSGIALYIPWAQYTHRYPPHFDWSTFFSAATIPAWIAVLLLFADVMLNIGGSREGSSST
jgi:hypothetical protein